MGGKELGGVGNLDASRGIDEELATAIVFHGWTDVHPSTARGAHVVRLDGAS